jgi:hypothetical protein
MVDIERIRAGVDASPRLLGELKAKRVRIASLRTQKENVLFVQLPFKLDGKDSVFKRAHQETIRC